MSALAAVQRAALAARPILLIWLTACGLRVTPPAAPSQPTVVAVIDYGLHAGLLLPRAAGQSVEYAYGNWEYFALGRSDNSTALRTVLPARGTLGRTELSLGVAEFAARAAAGPKCGAILLTVERAGVAGLLDDLDRRFARNAAQAHENTQAGMTFVPDERAYWAADNCNGELARWLRQLGCRVRGLALIADVEIVAPESGAERPAP